MLTLRLNFDENDGALGGKRKMKLQGKGSI
jgi:hypothetical protein